MSTHFKSIIVLILFYTTGLFPQQPVKQITFYDSDVKNASFFKIDFINPFLLYQVHSGNSVNIHFSIYYAEADSFLSSPPVTEDQYQNLNPLGLPSENMTVVYQTNKNGNWDLVYKTFTGTGWSEPIELLATAEDEVEPKLMVNRNIADTLYLLCRQGNNIVLLGFMNGLVSQEIVYSGGQYGLNNEYSGLFVQQFPTNQSQFKVVTTEQTSYGSKLIYKYRSKADPNWTEPIILADSGNYADPIYFAGDPLFFENETQSVRNIFYKMDDTAETEVLHPEVAGNKSELSAGILFFITGGDPDKFMDFLVAYKLKKDDSSFIRLSDNEIEYSNHLIKTEHPDPAIQMTDIMENYLVYHTIWEDSADGTIQLFGKRTLIISGGVNDEQSISGYKLYQNYPNPFNPDTRIKYVIPADNKVSIKVFDILGNELAELVNKHQVSGEYTIEFKGGNLASGIYIIRMNSGVITLSKKLILLK